MAKTILLEYLEILRFLLRKKGTEGGFPRGFVRWAPFEWPSFVFTLMTLKPKSSKVAGNIFH
jgi:hypothetical protein